MNGTLSPGATYSVWQEKRRFIADAIDSGGSILDIGCANGFLLKSLQDWSGHSLVPYGIDIDNTLIAEARRLFPECPENFRVLDVREISTLDRIGLPVEYDFVFWNFLRRWDITHKLWQTTLASVLALPRKRLILGFYGANQSPQGSDAWSQEREQLLAILTAFEAVGFRLSGYRVNPTAYNQVIAWINRP